MKKIIVFFLVSIFCFNVLDADSNSKKNQKKGKPAMKKYEYDFRNPELPLEQRLNDLLDQLTIEEKISLMTHEAAAVPRLGIPYYNWWNECLHGIGRSVPATVFPQAIGMAATFDTDLIRRVGDAISTEARAIYHNAIRKGIHKQYMGLTFWSPNVNIFRDPRWGRGHETYGEDPYLSGKIGAAFVKGIQGNDPKYLKAAACAKHYAVHNGPESSRHHFNAKSNPKDLRETYLPAYLSLIDADVAGFMCAYNRTNDEACCGGKTLLVDILREELNFKGYVVSDCGALNDLHANHKVTKTPEESAAMAIKADVNVNCGSVYRKLGNALEQNLISEKDIDKALAKQLRIRFRLGMFDPEEKVPYTNIGVEEINSDKHVELAKETALKSIVLLKNKNNVLPLKEDIGHLYVTGHNAADVNVLLGNYFGVSGRMVTVLEGIAGTVSKSTVVQYSQGLLVDQTETIGTALSWNAVSADATIAVVGISPLIEGEEGDAIASPAGGDRKTIELPESHVAFLKDLKEKCGNKPLIVVICSGSAIAIPEVQEFADAILWAWYPGEQGGNAVAEVIFGKASPSGRLPVTIHKSTEQLGDFEDYSISNGGRTYKYMKEAPLYPFGFGLTYGKINYEPVDRTSLKVKKNKSVKVNAKLTNSGQLEQEEVAQLYVAKKEASFPVPQYDLKSFQRVKFAPGESKTVEFEITPDMLSVVNTKGEKELKKGEYSIWISPSCPSPQAMNLGSPKPVTFTLEVY